MKRIFGVFILIVCFSQCRHKEEETLIQFPGKPEVPSVIKQEHDYLLDKVYKMTLWKDSTGLAAIKLYDLMKHHFAEEEDYVLPPLGLLPLVANGKLPDQIKDVILLTEKVKSHLIHLDAEHQLIKAFADELMQAGVTDNHSEIVEFEKELEKHAKTEEEVFFPAAILLGEYLKLKLI